MDRDAIRMWLRQLDQMTYYQVLGLGSSATTDAIGAAFHAFSGYFHPDQHRARPDDERNAIAHIFRRGAEAYRVLGHPELRARYDAAVAQGQVRVDLSHAAAQADARVSVAPKPIRLEDQVRNPSARTFVRRAEELAARGDHKQALLQVRLAMSMDRDNPHLATYERSLLEASKPTT
jgi:DnaJ-class molecular chaperone